MNSTISIFGNKIFSEIINEINLFSKYKIIYFDDFNKCIEQTIRNNTPIIFFLNKENKNLLSKIKKLPLILVCNSANKKNTYSHELFEYLISPFKILELENKIISIVAKGEFRKNSLINLNDYIIDKNERKIKKNNLDLQLSEKEVNFLILFSENKEPLSKNFVLKKVWNYSTETETHTVETHIHRLRKKILEKFGDRNFIKNNSKGYYI